MTSPKITVVTPSYNQGQFIERTILSIINQNYPNLEYIICDGGSTDNTIDILKKYNDKIDYWVSEKDKGQTDAINKGMLRASGDIVCWINSDDILLPGALKYVSDFFIKNPGIDFLMGITIEIDRNDYILKKTHSILNKFLTKHGAYNVNQQGMFWKRKIFKEIGYLDETFHACMDIEFIIRIMENNIPYTVSNKPLGAIRVYSETKTAIGGKIWDNDWREISKRYNGYYVRNKRNIFYWGYGLLKLLKGYYLNDIFFKIKNNGKKVSSLYQI